MFVAVLSMGGADAFAGLLPVLCRSLAARGQPAVCGGPPGQRRRGHPARSGTDLQPGDPGRLRVGRRPPAILSGGSRGPARVLARWGVEASDGRAAAGEAILAMPALIEPFLCFQRRSPGDVVIGETKVAGSAQRRCQGAVLATWQRALGPVRRGPRTGRPARIDRQGVSRRPIAGNVARKAGRNAGHRGTKRVNFPRSDAAASPSWPGRNTPRPLGRRNGGNSISLTPTTKTANIEDGRG